ncbi:MAG: class I SAM-dependent methyltransferase [Myxococcota bacterium]
MTTTGSFWDGIAEEYAARPVDDVPSYEAKLKRLHALVGSDDRVLEVGCGTASTALMMAPHVRAYVATDISAAMARIASQKLDGEASNAQVLRLAAHENVPGAPFDAVFAFSLLHLVHDLDETLSAIRRQLRPGGLFVSKTVCLGDRSVFLRAMVRTMTWVGKAPYVRPLTRIEVQSAIAAAGFLIEEVSHFGDQASNPFIVARRPPQPAN